MKSAIISLWVALSRFRQLRRSLVFCLVLLLSICSATDSFQQIDCNSRKEPRAQTSSLQTATVTTSISLAPAVVVYGGAAATADASPQRRRWNIFDRERKQAKVQQRRRRRRRRSRVALDDKEYQRRKQEW